MTPALSRFLPALAAGTVLRLLLLTRQNLWVDEILTLRAASVGEPFRWGDVLLNPQGPLPHLWLRAWIPLFGDGDLSLRLWAALAGAATLVLAAFVFRAVLPRAAVIATWLLALSPFHIWYSQEVRNYVFLAAASLAVFATLLAAVERPAPRRWIAHAAALIALLLCNLSGVFLLPVIAVWVFAIRRRGRAAWTLAAAAALAAASPWILREAGSHVDWRGLRAAEIPHDPQAPPIRGGERLHPGAVPYAYATFLGGFGAAPPLRALHGTPPATTWLVCLPGLLALAGAGLILGAGAWRRRGDPVTALLLLWVTVPVACAALVAMFGLKAFNPRYLTAVQPLLLVLLAVGAAASEPRARRWGLGLLVAVMVWGWARQTFLPAYAREDFRGVAAFLQSRTEPEDLILQQGVDGPLARYYRGGLPLRTYHQGYFSGEAGGHERFRELVAGHPRVWWVGSRLWYEDPDGRVRAWLAGSGEEIAAERFPGVDVRGFRMEAR